MTNSQLPAPPTADPVGHPQRGSGDGYVETADGTRFWGKYGAAGVLLRHVDDDGQQWFLLAQRSAGVHNGNLQWALPGGAIDAHETPLEAALREFDEEIGPVPAHWTLRGIHVLDPADGLWTYSSCCVDVTERPTYGPPLTWEHEATGWFTKEQITDLSLFAPVLNAWPALEAIFEME